jgi:hypothetical protein
MSDRELLEKAAKAAGVELVGTVEQFIVQFDERHKGGFIVRNERGGDSAWNPIADDGDALRLAVTCRMTVAIHSHEVEVFSNDTGECLCSVPILRMSMMAPGDKPDEAGTVVRRAIVRAAAALGDSGEG